MKNQNEIGATLPCTTCCASLVVAAQVRYWEDATVNGEEDHAGNRIPLRCGGEWCPTIDLATGKIQDWPEGTTADIHYKVCDAGAYWLADAEGNIVARWMGYYVPDKFLCHGDRGFGDYIILKVDAAGMIEGWTPPEIDADEWKFSSHNSPDQPRPKPSAASDCSEILSHELKPESNPMKNIRFHAQRDPFRQNAITLRCGIIDTAKETIAEATSITFTERNLDECVTEDRSSLLTMTENEARGLMDELWIHGIRPSTEFGSVGHLASTERHLDDMRTIAFHKLGIITAKKP